MSEIKWKHEKFNQDCKKAILALRLRVFNEPSYDENRWEWQYIQNPQGKSHINIAVDQNDATILAGHYAVIPYRLKWKNENILAVQSLDTFTNPDYLRQGVFVELAEKNYQDCLHENVEIVFGFPNQASYPGFVKKLSFIDPFGFKVFKKTLRLGHFTNRFIKNKFLSQIPLASKNTSHPFIIKEITKLGIELNSILDKFNNIFPFMIFKDLSYLKWRYENCPDRDYKKFAIYNNNEILGFYVLGFDRNTQYSHLVDFAFKDISDFSYILDAAVTSSLELKSLCLTFFTNENSKLENLLCQKGFSSNDKSQQFRFILRRLNFDKKIEAEAQKSDNWLITPGDTDFY